VVDSVEIDPVVVDVSRRYFFLPEDERIDVHVADARRYVQTTDETYDVVVVDAYYADSLPFHLTTEEFYREVKERMAPDGVLAYNVISAIEGDGSRLFRSTYRTAEGVWEDLWVFGVDPGHETPDDLNQNIIVLATDAKLTEDELLTRIETRVDGKVKVPGFEEFSGDLYEGRVKLGDVPKLTDSHAPTDSLIEVN
jgi:spermidine synthase